jgi:hypothetical protein
MYIAVVYTNNSGRPNGDLASFVSKKKEHAIKLAIAARDKWQGKGFGPYSIYVGKLTEVVETPKTFTLTRIASVETGVRA